MSFAFVVQVLSDDRERAQRLADALAPRLVARRANARVEAGTRPLKGTVASVGVIDAHGLPRWLAPLQADGQPDDEALAVVRFLERWGFVTTVVSPAS